MRCSIIPRRRFSPKVAFVGGTLLLLLVFLLITIRVQIDNFTKSRFHVLPTTPLHVVPATTVSPLPTLVRKNVFFLKTHKCASSTLQNIFIRFGLKHNLSFAIPDEGHTFHYPQNFNITFLLRNQRGIYNVLCHHLRFNYYLIRSFMPADTVYVSVIRNVFDMYESAIHYFHGSSMNLVGYINSIRLGRRKPKFTSRNPMLYDFGIEYDYNVERYQAAIRRRVDRFDLIMIVDYFDESLILLKHLLGLEMSDVVYVKHNMRTVVNKTTPFEQRVILKWNAGDVYLFDHVNQTFWKRVEQLGYDRMRREVDELRLLRKQWLNECVESIADNFGISDKSLRVAVKKIYGFNLRPEKESNVSCRLLVMPEIPLSDFIAERQQQLFP